MSLDDTTTGLPPQLTVHHALALPAGTDVLALATAWFPQSVWLPPPAVAERPSRSRLPAVGWFRVAEPDAGAEVGDLRLTDEAGLHGPFPIDAADASAAGLPARAYDAYAAVRADAAIWPDGGPPDSEPSAAPGWPAGAGTRGRALGPIDPGDPQGPVGLPRTLAAPDPADRQGSVGEGEQSGSPEIATVDDPQVLGWMRAAARRAGGVIVPAGGGQVIAPDTSESVDLTLWSTVALPAAALVRVARPMLSGARVQVVPSRAGRGGARPGAADPDVPDPVELLATYEYDGEVHITCERVVDVALVLTTLDWRAYGPYAYRVTWHSPLSDEFDPDRQSPLHVIARGRIAPHVARVVGALLRAVGGAVVDDGGFLISPEELAERSSTSTGRTAVPEAPMLSTDSVHRPVF